jgi:hypothetical protein
MAMKGLREPIEVRFERFYTINETTECWEWHGGKNNIGYGMIRDADKKGMRTAHRVSYEIHKGKIPKGKCVLHTCDNPSCVNPDHLWVGTHQENTDDMIAKNRHNWFNDVSSLATCKYCGYTCVRNLITRWHDENCKHKPKT